MRTKLVVLLLGVCLLSNAQPPIQKFWALNQPHYIYMNGSSGWQINNNGNVAPSIVNRVLTLTTSELSQASSAFYKLKMGMRRNFTATFTYTPSDFSYICTSWYGWGGCKTYNYNPADGICFVIQNATTTSLGLHANNLGYQGISPSIAIAINIYGTNGIKFLTNGVITTPYDPVSPVNLASGNPIIFTITYNYSAKTLTVKMDEQSTTNTTTKYFSVDIPSVLGSPLGWVGFTGATGGYWSTQTVSNFVFR
ncbi:L-type lectin-domain containing protein [Paludibacter jiangxiensis]|nr:L-type lectin-domain containing protein [Paludibacter jiangxiensis]